MTATALASVAVVESAYQSLKQNHWISVSDQDDAASAGVPTSKGAA